MVVDMGMRRLNGTALRVIRTALGVKHGELAARAHISAGFLTHLEKGDKQGTEATMVSLANALGVPLAAITYPVEVVNVIAELAA